MHADYPGDRGLHSHGGAALASPGADAIRIKIKMVDRDIIERIACLFGGNAIITLPQPNGWQTQYEITITGKRADAILDRVLPLLGTRRRQRVAELRAIL